MNTTQQSPTADYIRDRVAAHVPPGVLNNGNVRILGTGIESPGQAFYGLTLQLSAEEDCVYATGWLPEEGEHGMFWSATWTHGVETDRRLYWDPVTGVDYGWL